MLKKVDFEKVFPPFWTFTIKTLFGSYGFHIPRTSDSPKNPLEAGTSCINKTSRLFQHLSQGPHSNSSTGSWEPVNIRGSIWIFIMGTCQFSTTAAHGAVQNLGTRH